MQDGVKPEDTQSQNHPMPGYKEIGYHIIFDVKMYGKFTQKARLVANGNETEYLPKWDTYSSVVSRDSVHIELLYAAFNDLDIFSCGISNAYIEAPCGQKPWTMSGNEFISLARTTMQINRALYGLKSAGNLWPYALSTTDQT